MVKDTIVSAPILRFPNWNKSFHVCSVPFHYPGAQPLNLPFCTWNYKQIHLTQLNTLKLRVKFMGTTIIKRAISFNINSFTQRKT